MMAPPAGRLPRLSLAVQYAVKPEHVPGRAEIRRWVRSALRQDAEVTVRIVDEAEGRQLNRDYRGRDYATNVLTFAYDAGLPGVPRCGDVVLCAPVVEREAQAQHKSLAAHYAHLIVHGVLHLQGYDHQSEVEARQMEEQEIQILKKLGYADPYAVIREDC